MQCADALPMVVAEWLKMSKDPKVKPADRIAAQKLLAAYGAGAPEQTVAGTIDANVSIEVRRVYAGEHPPPVIDVTPSNPKALEPAQQNTTLPEAVEPDRVLVDASDNPDPNAPSDKPNPHGPIDEPGRAPTTDEPRQPPSYIPPIVRKRSK
jgi:hypothetical protein